MNNADRMAAGHSLPASRWLSVAVLTAILTAGWFVTPAQLPAVPLCLFQHFFHLDCPGCGLTRSFLMMARGNLGAAIHFNAAGPLIYFLFLSYFVEQTGRLLRESFRIYYPLWFSKLFSLSCLVLLFSHWILKMWRPT